MADNVELQIRAQNLTQQAFDQVSAALKAMEAATGQTTSKSSAAFGDMKDAVKGHLSELGASIKDIFENPQQGVEQLAPSIGGTLKEALSSIGPEAAIAAGALGGILAVATGIVAVTFGLAEHASKSGEEVLAFSQKTGIAIENVGQLQFAVTAAGGSLDSLSGILQHLTLKEANDQSGKFAAALKDIGINADAFAKMDNESRILALAKGFQEGAKSGNEMKDAIALMGRSGAESLPILMKLTPALMEMGAQLGVQWTKNSVEASEQFGVSMKAIETAIGGVATRIGIALLPALSQLVSDMATSPGFIDGVTTAAITLAHGLGYAIEGLGYIAAAAIDMGDDMVKSAAFVVGLGVAFEHMALSILKSMSSIPGSTLVIGGVITSLSKDLKENEDELGKLAGLHNTLAGTSDGLRSATQKIGDALTGLTASTSKQVEADLSLNKTHTDGGEAADKYAKAVQAIVDALEGDSKKTRETSDALDHVIALQQDDIGVKTRVMQAIEKLIAANHELTDAQLEFYQQNIELSAAYKAGQEELIALDQKYAQIVQKNTGETINAKLAADQREYDNAKKTLDGKTMLVQDYFAALKKLQLIKDAEDDAARQAQQEKDAKFTEETEKIWGDYYATIAKESGDTTEAQIDKLNTWYDAQVATLDQALNSGSINWTLYFQRIVALNADATAKQLKITDDYVTQVKRDQQTVADLWDQYDAIILARSGNTVDAQIKAQQRWASDQIAKLKDNDTEWQAHYDAIVALSDAKIQDIIHANDPLWAAWKGLNTDMRSSMASTWEQVLSGAKSWKDAMLQPFNDLRDGIKKVLAAILADWEQQLFNPLLSLAHNAMGSLMNMLTGGALGGSGGLGAGLLGGGTQMAGAGLLGGLFGGGGAAAAGMALPGTAIGALTLPGQAAGQIALGGTAAGSGGGLFGGIGLAGLGTLAAGAGVGAGGLGIGALIGNLTGSKTAGGIGGGLGGAAEGALIGSIVPGIGTAIGALIGGLSGVIGGLFGGGGTAGRSTVNDFITKNFGSFNQFHDTLNSLSSDFTALGLNSEQVWKHITQDIGRNDKEGANAAITQTIQELQQAQQHHQQVAAAAQTSTDQQVAGWTNVTEAIKAQLDGLDKQQAAIEATGDTTSAVAQAQLATIDAERKAVEAKLVEAQNSAKTALDGIVADATHASGDIQRTFSEPFHIKYEYDATNAPPSGLSGDNGYGNQPDIPGHADGAYIRSDHYAFVHAGEVIGPASAMKAWLASALQDLGVAGGGGGNDFAVAPVIMDTVKVADVIVRRVPNSIRRFTGATR